MPPLMQAVFSDAVDRIGHDPETQELYVTWKEGRTSVYTGVPQDVAQDVTNSWSVGKALRERVIPNYQHRYWGGGG